MEEFYATAPDPFGFDTLPHERERYRRTLELVGPGPFARALELGCSEGSFTALLAPRCTELVAVDVSATAVERCRQRLAAQTGVQCLVATLPDGLPGGTYDLVLVSDVAVYWPAAGLPAAVQRLRAMLRPGGVLLAMHYRRDLGIGATAEQVHDQLTSGLAGLAHEVDERPDDLGPVEQGRRAGYRIDRWRVPAAGVVAPSTEA